MFRSSLIAAGAALLCTAASAQQQLPTSRMYPITTPVRDAGTVDISTGKWTKPGMSTKSTDQAIYNNTCTWVTQGYYAGFDWCEENYDDGRIPTTAPGSAGLGQDLVEDVNMIQSIQVTYCTFVGPLLAGGTDYDMDLALWENLGGNCVGTTPPTGGGNPPVSVSADYYLPLAGIGLPGSSALGFQACWLVTLDTSNGGGLAFAGDGGNGTYDISAATDNFTWMQRQNQTDGATNQAIGAPDGFFISGEAATGGFGACSYNVPCGTDAIGGNTCGTGLDSFDASWINVDGVSVGAGLSAHDPLCANAVSQYGFGTNCYFFGGYPTNPFASYYLVMTSDGRASGGGTTSYCDQADAVDGNGDDVDPSIPTCFPTMVVSDRTLATGDFGLTNIVRSGTLGSGGFTFGIFIYNLTLTGQSTFEAAQDFGTLCLPGFKRTAGGPGTAQEACGSTEGIILFDQNAAGWASGTGNCPSDVAEVALDCTGPNGLKLGIAVNDDCNAQGWMRDPTSSDPGRAIFSNAVNFIVE